MLTSDHESYPPAESSDEEFEKFLDACCTYLAQGTSRCVYSVHHHPFVIKRAKSESDVKFNQIEKDYFIDRVMDQPKLARVVSWSRTGMFIVMERLDMKIKPGSDFGYPVWVTDRKPSNIGQASDGSYKICDYASIKSPGDAYKSPFGVLTDDDEAAEVDMTFSTDHLQSIN